MNSMPRNLLVSAARPHDAFREPRSPMVGRYALALFDSDRRPGSGYFSIYPAELGPSDNVFSGLQHPRTARNPDCSRLRGRSGNGRQLVCAIASIVQRLATQSLALKSPRSNQAITSLLTTGTAKNDVQSFAPTPPLSLAASKVRYAIVLLNQRVRASIKLLARSRVLARSCRAVSSPSAIKRTSATQPLN